MLLGGETSMTDFRSLARDPKHRRNFEKLLYLAARHGDADRVAERLSWGIDPNCRFSCGRTPLIANARGFCPSSATAAPPPPRGRPSPGREGRGGPPRRAPPPPKTGAAPSAPAPASP